MNDKNVRFHLHQAYRIAYPISLSGYCHSNPFMDSSISIHTWEWQELQRNTCYKIFLPSKEACFQLSTSCFETLSSPRGIAARETSSLSLWWHNDLCFAFQNLEVIECQLREAERRDFEQLCRYESMNTFLEIYILVFTARQNWSDDGSIPQFSGNVHDPWQWPSFPNL